MAVFDPDHPAAISQSRNLPTTRAIRQRAKAGATLTVAAGVSGLLGCGEQPTERGQLVLAISTDMSVDADLDRVDVFVQGESGTSYSQRVPLYPAPDGMYMPGTFVITAGDKEGERVSVSVVARKNGKPRVVRELVTTLPKRRSAIVPMPLQWLCDGEVADETPIADGDEATPSSTCQAEDEARASTCALGICAESTVDSSTLEDFDPTSQFGGYSSTFDAATAGACFDALRCFEGSKAVAVDLDECTFPRPSDLENLNLGLVVKEGAGGFCNRASGICHVPLDESKEHGWQDGQGTIRLPEGVCLRLRDGRLLGVVATGACETKGTYTPLCGLQLGPTGTNDRDEDTIDDGADNCPALPNRGQADSDGDGIGDSCDPTESVPDADGDGVADEDDNCPTIANLDQHNQDGNGRGDACDEDDDADGILDEDDPAPLSPFEPDADGDGLRNDEDDCPTVENPEQEDLDGDGLGDACDHDGDGDGIADKDDNCPLVANPDQANCDAADEPRGAQVGDACDTACAEGNGASGADSTGGSGAGAGDVPNGIVLGGAGSPPFGTAGTSSGTNAGTSDWAQAGAGGGATEAADGGGTESDPGPNGLTGGASSAAGGHAGEGGAAPIAGSAGHAGEGGAAPIAGSAGHAGEGGAAPIAGSAGHAGEGGAAPIAGSAGHAGESAVCGNAVREAAELCDDGNTQSGDGCDENCTPTSCGNGIRTSGEPCDEGPGGGVSCNPDCTLTECGDGFVNSAAGEECEPPGSVGCTDLCRFPVCGDGHILSAPALDATDAESCDPGAQDSEDCNGPDAPTDLACQTTACGDGYVNPAAETCETAGTPYRPSQDADWFLADTSDCNGSDAPLGVACNAPRCGDGYANAAAGEDCDTSSDTATCNGNVSGSNPAWECQLSACGDGHINSADGEDCDTSSDSAECNGPSAPESARCRASSCGDGYVNSATGEACDDGNNNEIDPANGDTCSADCTSTGSCGNGTEDPAEDCDGGQADTPHCNGADAGGRSCQLAECGDGYTNGAAGEDCDGGEIVDGGASPRDTANCNADCTLAACGDEYLNPAAEEECDNGSEPTPTCNNRADLFGGTADHNCRVPECGDSFTNTGAGEGCDPPGENCTALCQIPTCGDGQRSGDEECDDADTDNSDDCVENCRLARCGDGYVNTDVSLGYIGAEECDPGLGTEGSGAVLDSSECNGPEALTNLRCRFTACGDGYVNLAAETCETEGTPYRPSEDADWLLEDTAQCNGSDAPLGVACNAPRCGDGYANAAAGEDCDTSSDTATCNGNVSGSNPAWECQLSACGDGHINSAAGEDCDSSSDTSTCNGNVTGSDPAWECHAPACGDGHTNSAAGEDCDTSSDTSTCNANDPSSNPAWECQTPTCGDGHLNSTAGETCDDGNLTNGDGCDSNCTPTACGNGIVTPGEDCETPEDTQLCNANVASSNPAWECQLSNCGDGHRNNEAGEECDDGNNVSGDGCDANCENE